jgi:hypothetical protein
VIHLCLPGPSEAGRRRRAAMDDEKRVQEGKGGSQVPRSSLEIDRL